MRATKVQLRKLETLAGPFAASSEYVILHDGSALATLHAEDGEVELYVRVDRRGRERARGGDSFHGLRTVTRALA